MDYHLAKILAAGVITEKPFHSISEETLQKALAGMEQCDTVIYAGIEIGEMNRRVQVLIDEAEKAGKLEIYETSHGD